MARPLWLSAPTRFAALSRRHARAALALVALLLLACLTALVTPGPPAVSHDPAQRAVDQGDPVLYEGIVEAVRHGGNYYAVAADALRQGDYPLRPFVTFRLPTLAVTLAALPARGRAPLLYLLALAVMVAWAHRLRPAFTRRPPLLIAAGLLAAGTLAAVQPLLVSFHDVWAGLLIALSLARRRPGRFVESIGWALSAMLIRELAALYAVVMALTALAEGRRRESLGWLVALALFGIVLGVHAYAVAQVVRDTDPVSPGWKGMLGFGFFVEAVVLSTALQLAPMVVAALLFGLALLGWAGWRDPLGVRMVATLASYGALLALAGRTDTFYWALLIAPASLVGLAMVPDALRELVAAALDRRRITVTRLTR